MDAANYNIDDDEVPSNAQLAVMFVWDSPMFSFQMQRFQLHAQYKDLKKQSTMLQNDIEQLKVGIRNAKSVLELRLGPLRALVRARLGKTTFTREQAHSVLNKAEIGDMYDLDLLIASVAAKRESSDLLGFTLSVISSALADRIRYMESMRTAQKLGRVTDSMEYMKGYDLTESKNQILAWVKNMTKEAIPSAQSIKINQLQIKNANTNLLQHGAMNKNRAIDNVLTYMLSDEETFESVEDEQVEQQMPLAIQE
jgi:hypothetical protein